ncbi:hypothetical protein HRI_001565500 [Hibiscus trionum]|uniref:AAA+ ATPase domain-containing protein n=1 Tax=Hibiscus trionum TaxID=183268 RepID=A0A9W7LVA0_HIBTR|nr:hypothetical protein HRI_001565500 [Hibiscus trionum]
MDFVTAIVGPFVTIAVEYTISPIKYLYNHGQNVQTLKDRAETLKGASESLQHRVDAAKRNGEEIEGGVDTWLSKSHKIHEEVEKVMQDEEKAKRKCLIGLCPNPWTRYKHSRKAAEETKAVAVLLEQGKFDRVSHRSALQDIKAAPIKGFEEFESRTSVLKEIMEALQDDSVSIIGVHGMGGIGKTTLVREVSRQVKEDKLFDSVVIATVTQTPGVEKIQNEIADSLGLSFNEQSTAGKAHRLKERLKKEKNILVVLDDIWAKLDIEEVGIPSRDDHKGCKLLLTSRELNVLSNGMDAQRNFAVGVLKEEEAWHLFRKMAGHCVESSELQPTATEIAKKCGGLPIAIATVARALRSKNSYEWKNALRELHRPSSSDSTGIAAVYSAIEGSYSYLKSEEVKQTFMLCCLIGHNGLIEDLVRYTMGLDLFGGVYTMGESRHKVLTVVDGLKSSCLLLDGYNDKMFGIHDIVRDTALNIASRDRQMLVLRDSDVPKEWSGKEKMKNCNAISLGSPQIIAELPQEMECSSLSLFHMAHDGSVEIPPHFFRGTKSLKVLDLFEMQFPSLPESINHLTDLRMLCLKGSAVEDITIIGELTKLEILNLAHSSIKALPEEMAHLSRLKLLDLSSCSNLIIIPPDVLSRLSKLEELYMDESFAEWEDADVVGNERRNASLDELNSLRHLTTLHVDIPDAQMIPKHWSIKTLEKFRIFIGNYPVWKRFKEHGDSRILKLKLYRNVNLGDGVKMLLRKTEDLYLEGLEGTKHVLEESYNGDDFSHLKRLRVKKCKQVQHITIKKEFEELRSIRLEDLPQLISFCSQDERNSTSSNSEHLPLFGKQVVFHGLESLELCSIKAKRIWHNHTYSWVSKLTTLIISGCSELEHLLSPSLATSLVQLQRFEIKDCECLREIIFTEEIEEESKDVICFPQLNSLYLEGLQNLIMFCSGNYNIQFPLLKALTIESCPKLKEFIGQTGNQPGMQALFNEKVALPSLETMTISKLEDMKMIFHNHLAAGSFCKLKKMGVRNCDDLKNLFPVSIAKDLPQLKHLTISDCGVEEIVSVGEGVQVQQPVRFEFPRVSSLELRGLNKLKCFFEGQHTTVWPMLKNLTTDYSILLKILPSTNGNEQQPESIIEEVIPKLEQLELQSFVDMDQFPPDLFRQIKVFKANGSASHAGSSIFPSLRRFFNLESLELSWFDFKDEVPCKGEAGSLSRIRNLRFITPKNLKHIWKKDSELGHVLSNLQTLTVWYCDDLINIGPSSLSFQNLTTLEMSRCGKMTNLVTPSQVQNLVQLTTLEIKWCSAMTEIVGNEGDGATYHQPLVLRKLKCLQLLYLESLTSFCSGNYSFEFPCLEELAVHGCPELKIFSQGVLSTPRLECVKERVFEKKWHWRGDLNTTIRQMYTEKVGVLEISDVYPELMEIWNGNPGEIWDFQSLERIKFCNCSSLKYIFTPSMLLSLKRLRFITVKECSSMEEVIREEEEATRNRLRFPLLEYLFIEGCSNLTSFYLGTQTLEFPELWSIRIAECPKMSVFSSSTPTETEKDKTAAFFTHKVVCPKLWRLELSSIDIQTIWHGRALPSSLNGKNLHDLKVKGCHNLKYLFPSFLVKDFVQLRSLGVKDCKMMEQVIFTEGSTEEERRNQMFFSKLKWLELEHLPKLTTFCFETQIGQHIQASNLEVHNSALFNEKVVFPSLEKLTITGMRNCTQIWQDQLTVNSFCKLKKIRVEGCEQLLNIFPFNMVGRLEQLAKLLIKNCDSLEEIIGPQGIIANESHAVTAPQSMAAETVTTKFAFPKLTCLVLDMLPRLRRFYSRMHATEWPSLKRMDVIECPKVQIFAPQCHRFRETPSGNQVAISNQQTLFYVNEDTFPVLEELTVSDGQLPSECFREVKLQSEGFGNEGRHTPTVAQIQELRLSKLPELTHLWKEELQPGAALCNLGILIVLECGKLKTLGPSLLSLENLTSLEVSRCHGFINLMACSTAKTLTLLEKISITDCERMEEIIACENKEIKGGIVFPKLKYLQLSCLPSLASFSLMHQVFEFPVLLRVIVTKCPKMKNFCQGDLSTPKLQQMHLKDEEGELRWEGDLNTTIKHMFDEMNVQNSDVTEVSHQLLKLE